MRAVLCILCLFASGLSEGIAAGVSKEDVVKALIPAFEKKITENMKKEGIPGVAIAIVSRDKVYYLKTFGVKRLGSHEKVTSNTVFQVASLSKPMCATLAAVLQEKGTFRFSDPVHRYLPGFCSSDMKAIQILHLLSHSTGIPGYGLDRLIEAFTPRQKIIAQLQKTQPLSSPGERFTYNNTAYGLLEDIIKKASGKSLESLLKEELFTPLGMKHANLGLQEILKTPNRAYPHVVDPKGKYTPAKHYSRGYYTVLASAGVNASLQDLIPFLQLYLGKTSTLLPRSKLLALTKPVVRNPKPSIQVGKKNDKIKSSHYGLGWNTIQYDGQRIVYHQGHLKGFRNFLGFMPEKDIGLIILTNAEKKHASQWALAFFDLYLKKS